MPAIKFSSACLLVKDFMEVTDNLIRDAYGDPYCSCARAPDISPKEYAFLADVWVPLQVTEKSTSKRNMWGSWWNRRIFITGCIAKTSCAKSRSASIRKTGEILTLRNRRNSDAGDGMKGEMKTYSRYSYMVDVDIAENHARRGGEEISDGR